MEGGLKALPLKTRAGQAPDRQTVRARANPAIRAAHARARAVKAEVHSREGRTTERSAKTGRSAAPMARKVAMVQRKGRDKPLGRARVCARKLEAVRRRKRGGRKIPPGRRACSSRQTAR